MYNVAEVRLQDGVDIFQGTSDIRQLTEHKKVKIEDEQTRQLLLLISRVTSFSVARYRGEVGADSQLRQRGADGVAGVRHGAVGAGGV